MSGHVPENSQFFDLLVASVATGKSIKDSAEAIGCSVDYAYEISGSTAFRLAVSQMRTQMMTQICGSAVAASEDAIRTLHELLADTPRNQAAIANGKLRLAAAKAVLGSCLTISENVELRERLDLLEQRAIETQNQ